MNISSLIKLTTFLLCFASLTAMGQSLSVKKQLSGNGPVLNMQITDAKAVGNLGGLCDFGTSKSVPCSDRGDVQISTSGNTITQYRYNGKNYAVGEIGTPTWCSSCNQVKITAVIKVGSKNITVSETKGPISTGSYHLPFNIGASVPSNSISLVSVTIVPISHPDYEKKLDNLASQKEKNEKQDALQKQAQVQPQAANDPTGAQHKQANQSETDKGRATLTEQEKLAAKGYIDQMQAKGQITTEQARLAKAEIDKVPTEEQSQQANTGSNGEVAEAKPVPTWDDLMRQQRAIDAEIDRKSEAVGGAVTATGNAIAASSDIDGIKGLVYKFMLPSDIDMSVNNVMYEIQSKGKLYYSWGFGAGGATYTAKNPTTKTGHEDLDDIEASSFGVTTEATLGYRIPFYKDMSASEGAFFFGLSGDYSLYFGDNITPSMFTLGYFAGVNLLHITLQFGGGTFYNDGGNVVNYKADSGYGGKSGMFYLKAGFVW